MNKKKTLLLTLMAGLSLVSANETKTMPALVSDGYEFFVSEHPLETACGVAALVALSWHTQKPAMIWNLLKDTKPKAVCPHNVEVGNDCRGCSGGKAIAVCLHNKVIGKWCRLCKGGVAIAARKIESRSRTPEVTCAHGKVLGQDCDDCRDGCRGRTATASKRRSKSPAKKVEASKKRRRRKIYNPDSVWWKCRHGAFLGSPCDGGDQCFSRRAARETCQHGKCWGPLTGAQYCKDCDGHIDQRK